MMPSWPSLKIISGKTFRFRKFAAVRLASPTYFLNFRESILHYFYIYYFMDFKLLSLVWCWKVWNYTTISRPVANLNNLISSISWLININIYITDYKTFTNLKFGGWVGREMINILSIVAELYVYYNLLFYIKSILY